jgi:hypothetical protein
LRVDLVDHPVEFFRDLAELRRHSDLDPMLAIAAANRRRGG